MEFSNADRSCKMLTATLQHPKTLHCIQVSVNLGEKRDSSAKSVYHWTILKCRQLIFSDSQIIASPILGQESQIHVVLDRLHYENKSFTELLQKLQLSAKEPVPVSKSIYESCLHYTIIAKIAPLWNQVGKYLVNGRNFLQCNQLLPAVKLDICINDENLLLTLRPLRVKLWPTNLVDFNIPTNTINNFVTNSISTISQIDIETQWVHVLPSLKKGQLLYINHHIPASCPYKTYKELRRHWKNMNPCSNYPNALNLDETDLHESSCGRNSMVVLSPTCTSTQDDIFAGHSSQTACSRNLSLMTPDLELSLQNANSIATNQFSSSYNVYHSDTSQHFPSKFLLNCSSKWHSTAKSAQLSVNKCCSTDNISGQIKDFELSLPNDKTKRNSKHTLNVDILSKQLTEVHQEQMYSQNSTTPKTDNNSETEAMKTQYPEVLQENEKQSNLKRVKVRGKLNDMEQPFKKCCFDQLADSYKIQ